jgi:hypothetical protein
MKSNLEKGEINSSQALRIQYLNRFVLVLHNLTVPEIGSYSDRRCGLVDILVQRA